MTDLSYKAKLILQRQRATVTRSARQAHEGLAEAAFYTRQLDNGCADLKDAREHIAVGLARASAAFRDIADLVTLADPTLGSEHEEPGH